MTADDLIRTWLAAQEGTNRVGHEIRMGAAIRAVLDLCEPYGDPRLDATPTVPAIRRAIATALGVHPS